MDKETVQKVIDTKIAPVLASHGGSIELIDVRENVAYVRLTGACGGCPHAEMTMRMGVSHILKTELPELKDVVAV